MVGARAELVRLLSPAFSAAAAEFRLEAAELRYEGDPASAEELDARLDQDLARGFTGIGPHLHDVAVLAGERDLRSFGSQGEQRLAVLSLLLAEADLLAERGPAPPSCSSTMCSPSSIQSGARFSPAGYGGPAARLSSPPRPLRLCLTRPTCSSP